MVQFGSVSITVTRQLKRMEGWDGAGPFTPELCVCLCMFVCWCFCVCVACIN